MKPHLYVVPIVDTEGPLEESLGATFDRIQNKFGVTLNPEPKILQQLQNCKLDLQGKEAEVAHFVSPRKLSYLATWAEVSEMIRAVTSCSFRNELSDSFGNPLLMNWFIIDVVGYKNNPRRKAAGFHNVWDVYENLLDLKKYPDGIGWHFHTVPVGGDALQYNTCWSNNDFHEQALARRIIERNSFTSLFRAGGNIERNDLSFWLEQFVPFDWSRNSSLTGNGRPGSQEDWRNASTDWVPYNPDFYDYRKSGNMRRSIFRCVEVDLDIGRLQDEDVIKAFETVKNGQSAALAFSLHDRRDLRPELIATVQQIRDIGAKYPDVSWVHSNAQDAANALLGNTTQSAPQFTIEKDGNTIFVESDQELFGPQPFLAVQEEGDVFYRDNFTIEGPKSYAYHIERPLTTKKLGIAGSNASGSHSVTTLDLES